MRKPVRFSAILGLLLTAPFAMEGARLISVNATNDGSGNGPSQRPQASATGDWVVFESNATNLVSPGILPGTNIFVRNVQGQSTALISVNSANTGVAGNGPSIKPRIAIASLRIVFESDATNLVAPATIGHQLFARLAFAGPTVLVSANSAGSGPGNGSSHDAVITPDGRYAVFLSNATNLVSGVAANGLDQVYLRDLQAGVTKMASVDSTGLAAGGLPSLLPLSVSDDGRYVAFTSNAILTGSDGNGVSDVYMRDVTSATTSLVSMTTATSLAGNGASFGGQISRDGSIVMYTSRATDLQIGITDGNGVEDVYLWYRAFGFSQLISSRRSDNAFTGNGISTTADGGNFLSYNGQEMAFRSSATDVATGISYPGSQSNIIGVNNFDGFGYTVDSADPTYSSAGDGNSNGPISLSFFGEVVAYQSAATNLSTGDTNDENDVFAHIRNRNVSQMVSRGLAGQSGNADSSEPHVSENGGWVVFSSRASDLDTLDTNGFTQDVFEQRICSGYLVDRQDDADAAFPGSTSCLAVGGGCTLRAAVDAANANGGGLICLPSGTYPLDLGTISIYSSLTIDGDGNATTIIDGQGGSQIFDVFDNNFARARKPAFERGRRTNQAFSATINNVTIVDGYSGGDGGAIEVEPNTALYVNSVIFSNNFSGDGSGGAITVYAGSELHVYGSEFDDNVSSFQGGAIWCDGLLDISFSRFFCNVTGNGTTFFCGNASRRGAPRNRKESSAARARPRKPQETNFGDGGAVWVGDSGGNGNDNKITEAEFYGNAGGGQGGAVYNKSGSSLTLDRVTAAGNDAPSGSGIYNGGFFTGTNCTISLNTSFGGPGIGFGNGFQSQASLTNFTFKGNSGQGSGNEIESLDGTTFVTNTIVDGDSEVNCSGDVSSDGHNIENGGSCGFTSAGDIQNTDPKLDLTLQYNGGFEQTILLLPGSPAIDAGDDEFCPPTDERGVARPQGASCDMGAVEMIGMTISDVSMAEGNSGTTNFVFTVTLSAPNPNAIRVQYATADDTATLANNDYQQTSGTLTFGFGATVGTITVPVVGDSTVEPNETFVVNLSNATGGALIVVDQGVGTIVNDDVVSAGQPSLSIGSVAVVKPASGTVAAVFPVTMSSPSASDVVVSYASADGTAHSPADYQAVAASLVIPAGSTSASITVLVKGNAIASDDKAFTLAVFNPVNAVIAAGGGSATGLIQDRTALPSLSIGDVNVTPGGSGTTPAAFVVTLSSLTGRTVSVNYSTADGTATAGTHDYLPSSGTLFFAPGETSKTVNVSVVGKPFVAPTNFFVDLSPAVNATVARPRGTASINRAFPSLSIGDAAVQTPGAAVFSVSLSVASTLPVTVSFATADRTAFAGIDYTALSGALTFAPGETTKTITVLLLPGGTVFPTKVFQVILSNPGGALLAKSLGEAAIYDQSKPLPPGPYIYIDDVSVVRPGSSFALWVSVPVRLTGPSTAPINLAYSTRDGSAHAGTDYLPASGTLTIAPGETMKRILVPVLRAPAGTPGRNFKVSLANPFFADVIPAAEATVSIIPPSP